MLKNIKLESLDVVTWLLSWYIKITVAHTYTGKLPSWHITYLIPTVWALLPELLYILGFPTCKNVWTIIYRRPPNNVPLCPHNVTFTPSHVSCTWSPSSWFSLQYPKYYEIPKLTLLFHSKNDCTFRIIWSKHNSNNN